MITMRKGNMFDYICDKDYIVHCISGDYVLDSKIANQIDERYNIKEVLQSKSRI